MTLTNAELKLLKVLRTRRDPSGGRLFMAEGVRLLEEAVRFRITPEAVYVASERVTERGDKLVDRFERSRVKVIRIPGRQLDTISDTETSQGIVAVFKRSEATLEQPGREIPRTVLVCDGISDPGNLGTLFRSARAFGFVIVLLCGESADPFGPKAVRASAGTIFGLTVISGQAGTLVPWLKANSFYVLAADQKGTDLEESKPELRGKKRLALAVGSEGHGLSATILKSAMTRVSVKHEPVVESLNAAVAGSILMKGLYDLCHTQD